MVDSGSTYCRNYLKNPIIDFLHTHSTHQIEHNVLYPFFTQLCVHDCLALQLLAHVFFFLSVFQSYYSDHVVLLHLINIHDLITSFNWSILPIDKLFAVRYFRLLPNDLIP